MLPGVIETAFVLFQVVTTASSTHAGLSEMDRKAAMDEVREQLHRLEQRARADADRAQRDGDTLGQAEAEARLSQLRSLERRTNLRRVGAQFDRAHERWRTKSGWEAVTSYLGGKLFGAAAKGIKPGAAREAFEAGGGVGLWYDPSGGATAANIDPRERFAVFFDQDLQRAALPSDVGQYLARESLRKILRDNPQMQGERPEAIFNFACSQAREQLDRLLRDAMGNERAEAVRAAQAALCQDHYAGGTIDPKDSLAALPLLFTQRQVRMTFVQAGPVNASFDLQLELAGEQLGRLIEGIGEAAGGAAAAAVIGEGRAPGKQPLQDAAKYRNCWVKGTMSFRLEGRHDGKSTLEGSVAILPGGYVEFSCLGEHNRTAADSLIKGKRRFRGRDRGQDIELEVFLGDYRFAGTIPVQN